VDEAIRLIETLAWPMILLIVLLIFRGPLSAALEGLGGRVTRLSLLQVLEFELTPLPEATPDWEVLWGTSPADVRKLTSAAVFDSYAQSLFQQLSEPGKAELAVIDLGDGDRWLTSRLFLFSVLLERMRGVRCLALVATNDDVNRRLVGLVTPEEARWSLAHRYPWLERAFSFAYAKVAEGTHSFSVQRGALEPPVAMQVARSFLVAIQTSTSPSASEKCEWQKVSVTGGPGPQPADLWEHTRWIRLGQLEDHLGEVVDRRSWIVDDPSGSTGERTRQILMRRGPFVALVDEDRRLEAVVDRRELLDEAVRRLLSQPAN
jgi:hypothetical protein